MKKIVSALVMSVLLLFAAPASAWAQSNVTSLSAELNYTDISNKLTKIEIVLNLFISRLCNEESHSLLFRFVVKMQNSLMQDLYFA